MGTMSLTLSNEDGSFDPTNPLSQFYPNVLPQTRLRLRADWDGTDYIVFDGFVYAWPPTYVIPLEEYVTITVNDAFTILQSTNIAAVHGLPGEMTDDRIRRVLTDSVAGLDQNLDEGLSHMAAIPPPGNATGPPVIGSALALCQAAEQTEYGAFYVDSGGIVTFENRYHRNSASVSVNFSDDGSSISYNSLEPTFDMSMLYNDVQVTDALSMFFEYEDPISQAEYGPQTLTITSECDTRNEGYDQAAWIVQNQSQALLRFQQLQFSPQQDSSNLDNLYAAALGSDISTLVGVTRNTVAGNTINQLCFVEHIEHDITPESWMTRFGLSAASQTSANFWELDVDQLGVSTNLGY